MIRVKVERLPHGADLPLPAYQTEGAAALDLHAAVEGEVVLAPGETRLLPTGLKVAIPKGYELQIRPRSGLALKHRLAVLNSPGTIDSDYRGEVQVILSNFGAEPFTVTRGLRICQALLAKVERLEWQPVARVPETERGAGGFGHTGA
ncbi:MAG: dUTP diphosphatase [bacterium]|nr:dUTP diphosphatase [bacterium]